MRGLDFWDFMLVAAVLFSVQHVHHTEKHLEAILADIRAQHALCTASPQSSLH